MSTVTLLNSDRFDQRRILAYSADPATMVFMTSGGTLSLRPSFRVWVLVLLLLFLALCGVHLLGMHHDGGQDNAVGLATVVVAILYLALARRTSVYSQAQRPFSCAGLLIVDKSPGIRSIRAPLRV